MQKLLLSLSLIAFSQISFAEEILTLNGKGLGDHPCSVQITRDGNILKSVELKGSSEVFEILSETSNGYRPTRSIHPQGAYEVLSLLQDNPALYQEMQSSNGIFTDSVTYTLDTSDLPSRGEDLGPIKAKVKIQLTFKGRELDKVKAEFKAKALLVTLASSKFECN